MPFFENMGWNWADTGFCAAASVADTVMVLLIYYVFAFIYSDSLWVTHLSVARVTTIVITGAVGAIFGELRHLSGGSWSYSQLMPTLPVVDVGLIPVLQFMILPLCIYYLAYKNITGKKGK